MENKILSISQNSTAEAFLRGKEWDGKRWVNFDKPTFAEIANKYPELVKPEGFRAEWGQGHYVEEQNGMPKLFRSNFDSSD